MYDPDYKPQKSLGWLLWLISASILIGILYLKSTGLLLDPQQLHESIQNTITVPQ